jgi:hypothetical protein
MALRVMTTACLALRDAMFSHRDGVASDDNGMFSIRSSIAGTDNRLVANQYCEWVY